MVTKKVPLDNEHLTLLKEAGLTDEQIQQGLDAEIPVDSMLKAKKMYDDNREHFKALRSD